MSEDESNLVMPLNGPAVAGRPVDTGLALAIISVVLPFFSTVAVGLRSYWRFWATKGAWGWDDILAILSLASYIVACVFSFLSAQYGLGSFDVSQVHFEKALGSVFTHIIFYLLALALIKTSVALSVLRFSFQRRYRWPILGLAIITSIIYAFCGIYTTVFCGALFSTRLNKVCQNTQIKISVFVTITTLVTDAGCVLIPIFVIRNLRVSRRSKIGLMAAMGVGMLPLVVAVARIPISPNWNHLGSERQVYYVVFGPLLTVLEVGLALIASSLPIIGGMFKWFSQPAPAPISNLNMVAADVSATPAPADHERGLSWIQYVRSTKSSSTTGSTLQTEESSSGRSNSAYQTSAPENGRKEG